MTYSINDMLYITEELKELTIDLLDDIETLNTIITTIIDDDSRNKSCQGQAFTACLR